MASASLALRRHFLCCRYHAGPPDRPTLTAPFPQEMAPASFGGWGQGHSRGRWGLLYRRRATARAITRPPAIRSGAGRGAGRDRGGAGVPLAKLLLWHGTRRGGDCDRVTRRRIAGRSAAGSESRRVLRRG